MTMHNSRLRAPALAIALASVGAGLAGAPAIAGLFSAPRVTIASTIYVEHTATRDGTPVRSLEPAQRMTPGERVVTLVNWSRLTGNGGFTLVNALPAHLNYQRSTRDDEEVSVDGGHSWGHLGNLRIGDRLATPEDVTHLRWHVSPAEAVAGSGQIAYAGFVR